MTPVTVPVVPVAANTLRSLILDTSVTVADTGILLEDLPSEWPWEATMGKIK